MGVGSVRRWGVIRTAAQRGNIVETRMSSGVPAVPHLSRHKPSPGSSGVTAMTKGRRGSRATVCSLHNHRPSCSSWTMSPSPVKHGNYDPTTSPDDRFRVWTETTRRRCNHCRNRTLWLEQKVQACSLTTSPWETIQMIPENVFKITGDTFQLLRRTTSAEVVQMQSQQRMLLFWCNSGRSPNDPEWFTIFFTL